MACLSARRTYPLIPLVRRLLTHSTFSSDLALSFLRALFRIHQATPLTSLRSKPLKPEIAKTAEDGKALRCFMSGKSPEVCERQFEYGALYVMKHHLMQCLSGLGD